MTYTVGDKTFATKPDVRQYASKVLNRAGLGEILVGADELFARALLAHHPDAPRKQGVGVDAICVALIPEWGTRNFLVLREDGTVDNWSIKKCVTNLRSDDRA